MTKDELIQRLNDIEWEDFEVKEAKSEVHKSSWETVSAFSNTSGGWLVFGVKQMILKNWNKILPIHCEVLNLILWLFQNV